MEEAKKIANGLPMNWNADTPIASIAGAIIIANAMLSERERCAVMVERSKLAPANGETTKRLADKIRAGKNVVRTEFVQNPHLHSAAKPSTVARTKVRVNRAISRAIGKRATSMIRRRLGKE
jgi:hypothetical protein